MTTTGIENPSEAFYTNCDLTRVAATSLQEAVQLTQHVGIILTKGILLIFAAHGYSSLSRLFFRSGLAIGRCDTVSTISLCLYSLVLIRWTIPLASRPALTRPVSFALLDHRLPFLDVSYVGDDVKHRHNGFADSCIRATLMHLHNPLCSRPTVQDTVGDNINHYLPTLWRPAALVPRLASGRVSSRAHANGT